MRSNSSRKRRGPPRSAPVFGRKLAFAGQMLFDLPNPRLQRRVVRRECVAGVEGFDPGIRLMEDADFHARVMRKYGACFLDRLALSTASASRR